MFGLIGQILGPAGTGFVIAGILLISGIDFRKMVAKPTSGGLHGEDGVA